MIQLEFNLLIDRPVEQVFAFLTNLNNLPRWQSMASSVKQISSDPAGPGTTFVVEGELMGRKMENHMRVTDFEPNQKFGFEGKSGPLVLHLTVTLKPAGTGTKLNLSAQAEPGGLFKVAEGVLAGQVKNQMEGNFAKLKSLLESGAS